MTAGFDPSFLSRMSFGLPGGINPSAVVAPAAQEIVSGLAPAAGQAAAGAGLSSLQSIGMAGAGAAMQGLATYMQQRKQAKQAEQQAQALVQSQKLDSASKTAATSEQVKQAADQQLVETQGQTADQQLAALREIIGGFRSALLGG